MPAPSPPGRPGPIDLSESAAGEEDPGASVDMTIGKQAPRGTSGSGEKVCPRCGGSGQLGANPCPACDGTGKVIADAGGG